MTQFLPKDSFDYLFFYEQILTDDAVSKQNQIQKLLQCLDMRKFDMQNNICSWLIDVGNIGITIICSKIYKKK